MVGPTNAGKSTLLNALLGEKVSIVSHKPQTTRNRIVGLLSSAGYQIAFLDTPGVMRDKKRDSLGAYFQQSLKEACSVSDVTMLVLDAEKLVNHHSELANVQELLASPQFFGVAVIALNKVDQLDKLALLPLIQSLTLMLQDSSQVDIVPISALKKQGLEELKRILVSRIPEGEAMFPNDIVSDQPETFFISEIVREKMFRYLHQELPYASAVVVERIEELKRGMGIDATIVVERDSQKGIVIGKGGLMLKQIGSEARRELERHFDCQVTLRLFVRVEPGWTGDVRGLRKLGYLLE